MKCCRLLNKESIDHNTDLKIKRKKHKAIGDDKNYVVNRKCSKYAPDGNLASAHLK